MKNRFKLFIILIITTTVIILVTFFQKFTQKDVSVKCYYMGYACGDCTPQYYIFEILPVSLEKKFLKKDIDIEFLKKNQQEKFEKGIGIYRICYIYEFNGNLKYSIKKNCYVLKVKKYNLKLKNKNCYDN